ncbi:hypothetical protein ACTJJ7_17530 [Phyllobacterium sp. 22229]|uniref:hypothetical protein n=1 Tax=Phyllobacterium sp. 22229 TaxID=3453895 RepID=UPI003F8556C0
MALIPFAKQTPADAQNSSKVSQSQYSTPKHPLRNAIFARKACQNNRWHSHFATIQRVYETLIFVFILSRSTVVNRTWKNGSTGDETQQQYFTLMKAKVTVPLRKLVQRQSLFQKVK